ncbi:hypothetical protein KFK09_010348 [Dendrobium nobile]|uniref:DUF4283 domain-containing protein n=1 Tax=Dendrobium nobile TaxID=94219 RepID=A0A8T3BP34_DENNO|nr:hypothetical protein KFK09_010348 [Dendrobium nobile]
MASLSLIFPPLPTASVLGNPPTGLSYADNVSAPASKSNVFPVSFFSLGQKKLSFNSNDLSEGKSIWNNALIGYSLGPRLYYECLHKAMQKLWPLKGSMSLLSLANGFFLLKFSTSHDLESILSGSISRFASYIGIPISVDALTANRTRLTFAWVCVLISKDSILHEEIPLEIDGEDMVLYVIYDWKPDNCEGCGSLIHPYSLCPKNPNPQPILPPQPPKNRGRSKSRLRSSRPRRSPSKQPASKPVAVSSPSTYGFTSSAPHQIPNPQLAPTVSLPPPIIPPSIDLSQPPNKVPPLPNLNSPTEDSSSSDQPISLPLLPIPKILLVNKFASLQADDCEPTKVMDSFSENDSSSISKTVDEPPYSFDSASMPP